MLLIIVIIGSVVSQDVENTTLSKNLVNDLKPLTNTTLHEIETFSIKPSKNYYDLITKNDFNNSSRSSEYVNTTKLSVTVEKSFITSSLHGTTEKTFLKNNIAESQNETTILPFIATNEVNSVSTSDLITNKTNSPITSTFNWRPYASIASKYFNFSSITKTSIGSTEISDSTVSTPISTFNWRPYASIASKYFNFSSVTQSTPISSNNISGSTLNSTISTLTSTFNWRQYASIASKYFNFSSSDRTTPIGLNGISSSGSTSNSTVSSSTSTFDWKDYASIANKYFNFSSEKTRKNVLLSLDDETISTAYETTYDEITTDETTSEFSYTEDILIANEQEKNNETNITNKNTIKDSVFNKETKTTSTEQYYDETTNEETDLTDETTTSIDFTSTIFKELIEPKSKTSKKLKNLENINTKKSKNEVKTNRKKTNGLKSLLIVTEDSFNTSNSAIINVTTNAPTTTPIINDTSDVKYDTTVTLSVNSTTISSSDIPLMPNSTVSPDDSVNTSTFATSTSSISTMSTTTFSTFDWRTFLPTSFLTPSATPLIVTTKIITTVPSHQNHAMQTKVAQKASMYTVAVATLILIVVSVSCVAIALFITRHYRNHAFLDDSVALMSNRRGQSRSFYYDTSI